MQVKTFLSHYQIGENPFRAEEARHDSVFTRITDCRHPDFEKIRGDLERPATAIVCGEKGAGKTAIRLQIAGDIAEWNRESSGSRCLVVAYDDLNPVLDRFSRHVKGDTPEKWLEQFVLTDHMDAILTSAVAGIVDQALGEERGGSTRLELSDDGPKFRQVVASTKRDLLLLQLCYDRPDEAGNRTGRLRRSLRYHGPNQLRRSVWMASALALVTLGLLFSYLFGAPPGPAWLWTGAIVALALLAAAVGGRYAWLWLRFRRVARELARSLRVLDRPATSFQASLTALGGHDLLGADLPRTSSDEPRYAMLERLRNVIRPFGYDSIMILVDRVDEPTVISGDPQRMRMLVWPLLNNKFLQQESVGVKLLLPLELRYLLAREGDGFFREARLDKQNYIERLSWSGATLYDLCSARLNACRPDDESPLSLKDLFDESLTAQELIDVLSQMQQPRDAFKFLYELIHEHCENVPEDSPRFQIDRPTLEGVRKHQADRLSSMLRGVGPA